MLIKRKLHAPKRKKCDDDILQDQMYSHQDKFKPIAFSDANKLQLFASSYFFAGFILYYKEMVSVDAFLVATDKGRQTGR